MPKRPQPRVAGAWCPMEQETHTTPASLLAVETLAAEQDFLELCAYCESHPHYESPDVTEQIEAFYADWQTGLVMLERENQ